MNHDEVIKLTVELGNSLREAMEGLAVRYTLILTADTGGEVCSSATSSMGPEGAKFACDTISASLQSQITGAGNEDPVH